MLFSDHLHAAWGRSRGQRRKVPQADGPVRRGGKEQGFGGREDGDRLDKVCVTFENMQHLSRLRRLSCNSRGSNLTSAFHTRIDLSQEPVNSATQLGDPSFGCVSASAIEVTGP